MKISVIGGLGLMASPMAHHWKGSKNIQVLKVHDRGTPGSRRDQCRKAWIENGAQLVASLSQTVTDELDGIFVCCGKNADDLPIISEVAQLLSKSKNKFICHMSTVSTQFAEAAHEFCKKIGVEYVNYPLTGGPKGAEEAKMLILASGSKNLFDKLEPSLKQLGVPKYFGERVCAGAEVKFMGHMMVFNGLMGICSAVATHSECFQDGKTGGKAQTDFFDFLNGGAGSTKQWDLVVRPGISQETWEAPFLLKYAVVDALYVAELSMKKGISFIATESILNVALAFSYVLNKEGDTWATQTIVREMLSKETREFDAFLLKNSGPKGDLKTCLKKCIQSLPQSVQKTIGLDITSHEFSR